MKKYYIYPENDENSGVWCDLLIARFWFEWWIGMKTWFKLNPQRVCTITYFFKDEE